MSARTLFQLLFSWPSIIAMAMAGALLLVFMPERSAPMETTGLSIDGHSYIVEVASSPAQRRQGLMGRTQLPEGTGMLFVFPQEVPQQFWMKNTLIPLDILYFSREEQTGRFVLDSWHTAQPCHKDPCPMYPSQGAVKFAVELPAGTALRHGWKRGSQLDISHPSSLRP